MEQNYFNKIEFTNAINMASKDPFESKKRLEQYIENHPLDYAAYPYYASILITIGELDEAEIVLSEIKSKIKNDKRYSKKKDNKPIIEVDIIRTEIRLLAAKEKYQELLNLCLEFKERYAEKEKKFGVLSVIFYCRIKLGILRNINRNHWESYLFRQIASYDYQEFLEHIKKHLPNQVANHIGILNDQNPSIFDERFPIEAVLEEVKKHIPSDKKLNGIHIITEYIFKYDMCGKDNNKTVNFFKVVCLGNTSNIITMCPAADSERLPYVDLNYLNPDYSAPKARVPSGMERFKKRFGL